MGVFENLQTGHARGTFDELRFKNSQGVYQDITAIASGGVGAVSSASAPLSIDAGGDISLDTSGLATAGDMETKIDTMTAQLPVAVTGSGTQRVFSSLWKPSSVGVSNGLFALSSDSLGTLSLALTGQESRTQLRMQDPANTIRVLSCNTAGELVWDGTPIPSLNGLGVVSPLVLADTTLDVWMDVAGATGYNSYWIVQSSGAYAEVTYTSGVPYVRTGDISIPPAGTLTFSVQAMLTSGNATSVSAYMNLGTTVVTQATVTGNIGSWQTLSIAYTNTTSAPINVQILLGGGYTAFTPAVPTMSGKVAFRNVYITAPGSRLEYQGDFRVQGTVTATSFVTQSDAAIKTGVADLSEAAAIAALEAAAPKTYQRTDTPGDRVGFLAQDLAAAIPAEWGNVVHQVGGLLAVDYSRLTAILWSVCRNQEARIRALEGTP